MTFRGPFWPKLFCDSMQAPPHTAQDFTGYKDCIHIVLYSTGEELECLQISPFISVMPSILWHRGLGLPSEMQFHPVSHCLPHWDTGSLKSQWCSGEPGSLVHCNQVKELVMQFIYSNVNNSLFWQNKAMGVSWTHLYGCPKTGSNTLLRYAGIRKHTEKITWQSRALCLPRSSGCCSAQHPVLHHSNHQGHATKLQPVTSLPGVWLKECRHRPEVEGGLHIKQILLRDTSLHSPLLGITPTRQIWAIHKSDTN